MTFPRKQLTEIVKPNAAQRRALLLFAKVIQAVCNGELMAEPLTELNDMVQEFHDSFTKFLLLLSSKEVNVIPDNYPPMAKHKLAECFLELGLQQMEPDMTDIRVREKLSFNSGEDCYERFLYRVSFAAKMGSSSNNSNNTNIPFAERQSEQSSPDLLEELRKAQMAARDNKEMTDMLNKIAIVLATNINNSNNNNSSSSPRSGNKNKGSTPSEDGPIVNSKPPNIRTFFAPK